MGTRFSRPLGLVAAILLAALVVGTVWGPAFAAPGLNPNTKIAMHTKTHPTSCTKGYPVFSTCDQILTTWAGTGDFDAMPIFYDLAEITVVEFGLTWPVEWGTGSWVRCKGTIAVGGILNPGDGTAISWSTCQSGWYQAPGYIWLAASGAGSVTPIPYFATGDYGVVDCQSPAAYNYPMSVTSAGVGGTPGGNPCFVPTVPPTLTKTDNIGSTQCAFRGSDIVYTLSYTNPNTGGITGVTLVDSLPDFVAFSSASGGGTYDAMTGLVTWNIGALAAGANGSVTLTATVAADAPFGGVLYNNARITCSESAQTTTASLGTHVCACLIDGPTLVCPLTTTVFCAPNVPGFTYAWGVTGSGSIVGPSTGPCVNVSTGATCNTTYEVSVTVTDTQGIASQCQQTVTVNDTEPPVINQYPGDVTVQCLIEVPSVSTRDVRGTDNCGTPVASHVGDDTTGTACSLVVNRTYRLTDGCGNFDEVVQHIAISDTTDPVITFCPGDETVQCITNVPAPDAGLVIADDNCGSVVTGHIGDDTTGTACNGQVVRGYRAQDPCGNFTDCFQTFTILDATDPYFTSTCPTDTTVECDGVPSPLPMTAGDLCDGSVSVTYGEQRIDGRCANVYSLVRTWTATDDCGNDVQCVQTISVVDTTNPVVVSGPPVTPLQCFTDLPAPDPSLFTVSDNCGTAQVDWLADDPWGDACNGGIDREYTVTDLCGNMIYVFHYFTVDDGTAPVFTSHPGDIAVQCLGDVPAPNAGLCTATDNCGTPTIAWAGDADNGLDCPKVITRTYRATDPCGNSVDEVQLITVDDTEAPTLMCQSDKRVACGAPIVFDSPGVSDVCDPSPVLNIVADSSHVDPASGEVTYTRCWTATDACGNTSAQCCQRIVEAACGCVVTGVDETCPGASNQFCGPADMASYAWTISGDGFIATLDDEQCVGVVAGTGCDTSFTIRLDAVSPSGGPVTCQKMVRVVDDAAPVFTVVPDTVRVQCAVDVPAPDNGLLSATDDCSGVTITYVGDVDDGRTCPKLITRTYRATDACGNSADAVCYIRVHDTMPPAIVCPSDVTRECDNIGDTGVATASDNCDGVIEPGYDDVVVPGGGPGCYVIQRTWRATDACGNTASCVQRITVVDTVPPIITCEPDIRIGCTDPLVWPTPPASDACAGSIAPTVVSTDTVSVPGTGEIQYRRCWQAADGCGNLTTCCQTITRDACPFVPLELGKSDNVADCVDPGGPVTYILDYRNPNPGAVTAVTLVDFLSDDVTLVNAYDGVYSDDPPRRVTWNLGSLAGGETGQKIIDVAINPGVAYGSQVGNDATLDCAETEPTTSTLLTDVCEYTYVPLRLTKEDNVDGSVSPGDTIKYEIRCYNDNDVPVDNVTISDVLPEGVSLAWATSPYDYDAIAREITWDLGTLGAHSSLLVHLWVTVDSDAMSGDIVNTARVTSDQTPAEVTASHTTRIEGAEVGVHFDIKPESCPNPVNPKARGVLPAAVLGTERFDVSTIDPASLRLTREGIADGVAPLRWSYGDMSTPASGRPCDCNTLGRDGYRDLGLKFSLPEVVSALHLGDVTGLTVELTLTGMLNDGTLIRGMDCVRVLGRAGGGDGASLELPNELRFEAGDQVGMPDGAQIDLSFYSAVSGRVTMDIYDVHGRVVVRLLDSEMAAGGHGVTWNMTAGSGQAVPSGIYFVRLSTVAQSVTKKLIVVD